MNASRSPVSPSPASPPGRRALRVVGLGCLTVVCVFFIVRAVAEPFTVGDDYQGDWGGPTLAGVLAVHMVPGLIAACVLGWLVVHRRTRISRRTRRG